MYQCHQPLMTDTGRCLYWQHWRKSLSLPRSAG